MTPAAAYFLSDAHLGENLPYDPGREERLIRFFSTIEKKASHLFILGDLFDFWIEYRHAIRPDYFRVLCALQKLVDAGTEIHYLAGNHDFALGDFLTRSVGIVVHPEAHTPVLQGKRLYLHHGDGLLDTDDGYRRLKAILRNPLNQRLFKLLHPGTGIALATFFSRTSRGIRSTETILKKGILYRKAARRILDTGFDWVFFGHTHLPEITLWGERGYCNTGDWLTHDTYAEMRDGAVTLWRWQDDSPPEKWPIERH